MCENEIRRDVVQLFKHHKTHIYCYQSQRWGQEQKK